MNNLVDGLQITLENVSKRFSSLEVLRDVSLEVREGELLTLLGPSGCGKSTLLNIIAGYEHADTGTVMIGDTEVSRIPARKRGVGIVFQAYSLFPHLTARANIEFGLKVMKQPKKLRSSRVDELLHMIALEENAESFPHELSGGQQQRIALARALATQPRVLLLDEPLSALDAMVRVRLRDEIKRLQRESGITTIMVTHDQEEALSIADRVAVMSEGRIEQVDTPNLVYTRPATAFVADFVGVVNRLNVSSTRAGVTLFDRNIDTPVYTDEDSKQTVALIRPEQLSLTITATGEGVVESLTLRGPLTSVLVRHPQQPELIRVDVRTGELPGLQVGDRVEISPLASSLFEATDSEMEFA